MGSLAAALLRGQALFRSYGCFFAEFLDDLSLVRLGLLDLITCVGLRYGFRINNLRSFSWKRALFYFRVLPPFSSCLESPFKSRIRIYQDPSLQAECQIQLRTEHTTLRHSISLYESYGILTVYPSGAAFAIPLGPTNPWLIYIAKETLIFRRAGISPALRLLVPTFLLPHAPEWVTPSPSTQSGILSYRLKFSEEKIKPSVSVRRFSPDYLRRKTSR